VKRLLLSAAALLLICFVVAGLAQEQPPALDGPKIIFNDPLLSKMAGTWQASGTIRGRSTTQSIEAQWVLNHQFLQVHEKGAPDPKTNLTPYEAMVMVGYDHTSDRYVAHWLDIYGGRFSETLGYGSQTGDQIEFVFEYPDGPFHTIFRWVPQKKQWQWLMKTRDNYGHWVDFADLMLTAADTGR